MIAIAILFVASVFFLNNRDLFIDDLKSNTGLTYNGNDLLSDLVNRDSDGDGVQDWEESIWGTDPKKKDTDLNGVLDDIEISQMKAAAGMTAGGSTGDLTKTDQFSRELFATVAALSQAGTIDQVTVDKLSDSLATEIANAPQKKIYAPTDVNAIADTSFKAVKNYDRITTDVSLRYQSTINPIFIIQEAMGTDGDIDANILAKLGPVIDGAQTMIVEFLNIEVPIDLAPLHLNFINSLQRVTENLVDIKNFELDPLVALSATSQYETNTEEMGEAFEKLNSALTRRLDNKSGL